MHKPNYRLHAKMVAWNKFSLLVFVTFHIQKFQANEIPEVDKEITQTPIRSEDQIDTTIANKSGKASAETDDGDKEVKDSAVVEAAYIWIPVVALLIVSGGVTFILCRFGKYRTTNDTRVSYHSKKIAGDNSMYEAAVENSHAAKEDETFQNSTENVQRSSAYLYTEIDIGTVDSTETSADGYVTISTAGVNGENQKVISVADGTYDKLESYPRAKGIKKRGCIKAYDHVLAVDRNVQTNGTKEYSKLDLIKTNDEQQSKIIMTGKHQIDGDNKFDRKISRFSVQSEHSLHQYVILEPDGHYIVYK